MNRTLAYSFGLGKAVVSTALWHARSCSLTAVASRSFGDASGHEHGIAGLLTTTSAVTLRSALAASGR